jgi:outer membrane protein assembly factor BamB
LNPDDTQQWYFQTKKWIDSSPAVSKEGNMYFGSNDGSLYTLSSSGILLWTFTTNGVITSSPAIDSDGNTFFGSWDKKLYALSSDGIFLWSFTTSGIVRSSPTIGPDRTLYFCSNDGNLYAIGEKNNKYLIREWIQASAEAWRFKTGIHFSLKD